MATTPQQNRPVTPHDLRELNHVLTLRPDLAEGMADGYDYARNELVEALAARIEDEQRYHATMNLDASRTAEQKADELVARFERSTLEQVEHARATSDQLMRELGISDPSCYEWAI